MRLIYNCMPGAHLDIDFTKNFDGSDILGGTSRGLCIMASQPTPPQRTPPGNKPFFQGSQNHKPLVSFNNAPSGRSCSFHHGLVWGVMESPIMTSGPVLNGDVDHRKKTYPKNPWTLQWKGLNLYSRGPGPQNGQVKRFSGRKQTIPPWKFNSKNPEKWWLEGDPFLLGFGNFSGGSC